LAYTPDWEPLADALKRVVATGLSEAEAKTDLCHAVGDRKIGVRVRIAPNASTKRGAFFTGRNVGVPPRLVPNDFDWVHSRPLAKWQIGPMPGQHYSWIGGWQNEPLDLIELSAADVAEILCRVGDSAQIKK
jgi:hypothetical protein